MKNPIFLVTSLVIAVNLLLVPTVWSQSTVIPLPVHANSQQAGLSFPPSTLSSVQRRWEQILGRPHPEIGDRRMRVSDLLIRLRRIGLPVLLDQSAMDDSLDEDEFVKLELPGQPLIARLNHALFNKNALLAMTGQRLSVISLDVADDPEYFLAVSYDVSSLATDLQALTETIVDTVEPDGWDLTNGLARISPIVMNGRNVLTIYAPYSTHVQFRQMMSGMSSLAGGTRPGGFNVVSSSGTIGSRIVEMPKLSREMAARRKSKGMGIGGFGGGGGVF